MVTALVVVRHGWTGYLCVSRRAWFVHVHAPVVSTTCWAEGCAVDDMACAAILVLA
jgi:hypothetical protein